MPIIPNAPVQVYETFSIKSPIETHFRPASCEEADCPGFLNGWRTAIDESTDLGQMQAHHIRKESGRRFIVEGRGKFVTDDLGMQRIELDDGGPLTVFKFDAGQMCFGADDHRVTLEREPFYLVRGGDFRANLGLIRRHDGPDNWLDNFETNLDVNRSLREHG